MLSQVIQIGGALAILAAYVLAQLGVLDLRARRSLALNLVGSAALAVEACIEMQWGFLLLEASWAAVSVWGLLDRRASRRPAAH